MPNNWPAQIQHVVVLMMENRSFDHLLGDYQSLNPACEGVAPGAAPRTNGLTPQSGPATLSVQQKESAVDFNLWAPSLAVNVPANSREGFDLGHEFVDVLAQLDRSPSPSLANPGMDGFAQNAYSKARRDLTVQKECALAMAQRAMNYIPFGATPSLDLLPAIQGLARQFTVCDRWFASVPGPTWPNRFFAMLGSAHGRLLMPEAGAVLPGIQSVIAQLGAESIFSLFASHGHAAKVYSDGGIPLAALVKGGLEHSSLDDFKSDIAHNSLPELAWVEPGYGLMDGGMGANTSHHPPDDLRAGDRFVGDVFNALSSNAALWQKTLFVLLYDEHGGFYDHVVPPMTVSTGSQSDVNWPGVAPFTRLGVRVPAIFASPWLQPGLIPWSGSLQSQHYDHTSLLAFLCDHFNLPRSALGARVVAAQHFGNAPIWRSAPFSVLPPPLAAASLPAPTDLPVLEPALASQTRQVVDTVLAYYSGGNLEQTWQASAHGVVDTLRGGVMSLVGGVNAPATNGPASIASRLRRMQALVGAQAQPAGAPGK